MVVAIEKGHIVSLLHKKNFIKAVQYNLGSELNRSIYQDVLLQFWSRSWWTTYSPWAKPGPWFVFINKVLLKCRHIFLKYIIYKFYILFIVFVLQHLNWVVVTETVWPIRPNNLLCDHLQKKFSGQSMGSEINLPGFNSVLSLITLVIWSKLFDLFLSYLSKNGDNNKTYLIQVL